MVVWLVISSCGNDVDVTRILKQVHSHPQVIFDHILVVDSEGTGAIPSLLESQGWDRVTYRSYDRNLGSGANLRERLQIAANAGADYAFALNHDAYFARDVITSLLRAAEGIENLGAAYPLSLLTSLGLYNITGSRQLPLPAKLVNTAPRGPVLEAFWSSSNGALYSLNPVREGIVPWEALWMGWEDLEYGWRLHDYGYRQVIVCDAIFRDNYEYSSTNLLRNTEKPAWRTYYGIRNLILAIRRSRNRPSYYAIAAYRFFQEFALILLVRKNKATRMRFLWTGVKDGLNGVEGRRESLNHQVV